LARPEMAHESRTFDKIEMHDSIESNGNCLLLCVC
jgi:hypothetical protein